MNLLLLSPHRDDAAFSLALSIARWLAAGHRVTLLNVFTRSTYAPYSDADLVEENDRLGYVSAMRRREDEAFLKRLPGMQMIDLNLKDAPIRLRCASDDVCKLMPEANDTAVPKIQKAVAALLRPSSQVDAIVVPLALGHHVDHCVTRDAALHFAREIPTAFYEDLPYATREGVNADLVSFCDMAKLRLHPCLVPGNQGNAVMFKLKMISLYSSQIDLQTAEKIANFSERYQGAERLWGNELWQPAAEANLLTTAQPYEEAKPLP